MQQTTTSLEIYERCGTERAGGKIGRKKKLFPATPFETNRSASFYCFPIAMASIKKNQIEKYLIGRLFLRRPEDSL